MRYLDKYQGGLRLVLIATLVLIFISAPILYTSYALFHIVRLIIMGMFLLIVVCYGQVGIRDYSRWILGAFLIYSLSAIFVQGLRFEYKLLIMATANLSLIRAFVSFQGFTFITKQLLLLVSIAVLVLAGIAGFLSTEWIYIVIYTVVLILLCWQGINLYTMQKSLGYKCIFSFVVLSITNSILSVVNLYTINSLSVQLIAQLLYWLSLWFLAYSTTLSKTEFKKVKKKQKIQNKPEDTFNRELY